MKITHRNVPYSDIPRLVKEGMIKVGTRVKACSDQEKYPNGLGVTLQNKMIGTVSRISDNVIDISRDDEEGMIVFAVPSLFYLDILSDEEEATCKDSLQVPKPLSFSEPLTKEAVGRVVIRGDGKKGIIEEVGLSGNAFMFGTVKDVSNFYWITTDMAREAGWHFESSPDEITIDEAEKLTGKKIKR